LMSQRRGGNRRKKRNISEKKDKSEWKKVGVQDAGKTRLSLSFNVSKQKKGPGKEKPTGKTQLVLEGQERPHRKIREIWG